LDFRDFLSGDDNHFFLRPTSEHEVKDVLNKLRNSAAGYDELPSKIIKTVSQHISSPLAHIVNLSFSTGCVPDPIKIAKVTPVYKTES
jgi:hypothetical protein